MRGPGRTPGRRCWQSRRKATISSSMRARHGVARSRVPRSETGTEVTADQPAAPKARRRVVSRSSPAREPAKKSLGTFALTPLPPAPPRAPLHPRGESPVGPGEGGGACRVLWDVGFRSGTDRRTTPANLRLSARVSTTDATLPAATTNRRPLPRWLREAPPSAVEPGEGGRGVRAVFGGAANRSPSSRTSSSTLMSSQGSSERPCPGRSTATAAMPSVFASRDGKAPQASRSAPGSCKSRMVSEAAPQRTPRMTGPQGRGTSTAAGGGVDSTRPIRRACSAWPSRCLARSRAWWA